MCVFVCRKGGILSVFCVWVFARARARVCVCVCVCVCTASGEVRGAPCT